MNAPGSLPPCSVSKTFLYCADVGRPSKKEAKASPVGAPDGLVGSSRFEVWNVLVASDTPEMGDLELLVAQIPPNLIVCRLMILVRAPPNSYVLAIWVS